MGQWTRRAFLFGAWMTIATSALYAATHAGPPPPPDGPVEAQLRELATTHRHHILGVDRTMMDLMNGFGLSFSVLLLAWGVTSLLLARRSRTEWDAMRPATLFNALIAAGMCAVSAFYFVPPPTVCFALVTVAYLVALVPAGSPTA